MSDPKPPRRPLIWIVDDSPTEAAITQHSLGAPYDYELFADGSIVVERLSTSSDLPDLLLLDWVMPGMAGDEVCRFLRSRPPTRELPIIMVTASRIETRDIVEGLANGANDYVARPFAPEELRARVDAALRAKRLADEAARETARLATVNRLGHSLFQAGTSVEKIVNELSRTLAVSMCDGCAILLLPGPLPPVSVVRHRRDPSATALGAIASVADPVVHGFTSSDQARATLPPAYADYIARFGLRGLAILPFPSLREPVRGVVTVTRDGASQPFDAEDIATIETCIEYAVLAIESAMRFDLERLGRKQLDTVLANLPVGILAADADGGISLVNAAARELIPRIAEARTLRDVFAGREWSAGDGSPIGDTGWLLSVPQTQLPVSAELLLNLPDEEAARAIAVSAVPLRDAANTVVGTVTVVQDVSAERAISAERERTARFQEEMLGIVGHDLRNPLGAILTGTDVLHAHAGKAPDLVPTILRVQASAHRMTRIVEQLLDVTRARLGSGIPIAPRETSLVPVVSGVIEELSLAYPTTRFALVTAEDIRGVWDPDRLAQVVSNLMSNAAQYGRPGAPVTVELAQLRGTATIVVRNEIGDAPIPAETLALMFAPHRRGKTKAHATGLGLGLYIVHEIVRAHGGTIDVDSTDQGTAFRVALPIGANRSLELHP